MSNTTKEVPVSKAPANEATQKPAAETPIVAAPAATPAITGNWNEQKTKLKARFATLTDADLHYENGKKDEMLAKIQVKIGKTQEELRAILAGL